MSTLSRSVPFFAPRRLCMMGALIALQVILARFVGIQVNEGLRISFETIPILLSGLWLGPAAGALVGLLADLFGTLISGYGLYFPPLSVTPVLNAALCGLCFRYLWKGKLSLPKALAMVIGVECVASLLCGTWALTWYYSLIVGKEMPFAVLLAARAPAKLVTMCLDGLLVWAVHRAVYPRVIAPMLERR